MKVSIGPRDKFPLMSEINMIPLIDVSLVLLIIFMVVTPFLMTSQIKVNLPKAVSGANAEAEPVHIQITSHGTFYVNNEAALPQDLSGILRTLLARQKATSVMIEADASVPFESVIQAMDQAKLAGAEKLGVAVNVPKEKQKP